MLREWWWIVGDIFREQAPTATSIEIDHDHWISLVLKEPLSPSVRIISPPMQTAKKFSFFPERQKGLVPFGHDSSLKTILELQNNLSSFWKELV